MTRHYHVIGGLQGLYMPDVNDVCGTEQHARECLLWYYEDWQETIAQQEEEQEEEPYQLWPEGWPHAGLDSFTVERSETQIDFKYYITECHKPECLEDLED